MERWHPQGERANQLLEARRKREKTTNILSIKGGYAQLFCKIDKSARCFKHSNNLLVTDARKPETVDKHCINEIISVDLRTCNLMPAGMVLGKHWRVNPCRLIQAPKWVRKKSEKIRDDNIPSCNEVRAVRTPIKTSDRSTMPSQSSCFLPVFIHHISNNGAAPPPSPAA